LLNKLLFDFVPVQMGKTDPIEEINSYYTGIPVFENLTVLRLYWFFHVLFDWDDVMKMLQSCPKLQDITISKVICLSRP
jgi:hypothetical protein